MSEPAFVFTVDGSTYDHVGGYVQFDELTLYRKDGWPELRWMVPGGALPAAGADPFLGKTIALDVDAGLGAGSVRRFTGRCEDVEVSYGAFGWGRYYTAPGLRWMGDLVPHTDSVTGIDSSQFNGSPDDPDSQYLAGRLGRTAGQILQSVLDMPANAAALAALGIGGYSSAGSGAAAECTLSGGAPASPATVTAGGTGYTVPPTAYLSGGGGSGATATATVSAGAVTAVTISGGSGYTSPPEVVISALPLATVRDLAQMTVVPPFPVHVGGEKLLEAVEGLLRSIAPNHLLRVAPDGVMRFLDARAFAGPTVAISDSTGSGASFTAAVNASGVVTGFVQVAGGSGYSGSPTVEVTGGNGSGATGTAVVTGGAVASITLGSGGSGYSRPIALTLDRADAGGRRVLTDRLRFRAATEHCFSRVLVRGQPRIDGVWTGTATAPGGGSGGAGTAVLSAGAVNSISVAAGGSGYASPPAVSIVGGGGSGAVYTATVSGGAITGFVKVSGGSGYTSVPNVVINAPNGLAEAFEHDGLDGAAAKAAWKLADNAVPDGSAGQAVVAATVASGALASLSRQFAGYGYGAAPALHFSGGGGAGAAATCTVTNGAVDPTFTITNAGSGYTSAPTVSVDLPGGGNADAGSCSCPSATTVTVASSDPRKTWPSGYWDQSPGGRKGVVFLVTNGATGLQSRVQARILANTALAAGGTSTLTIDVVLPNTSFDAYRVVGTTGGGSVVWRRYKVVDPDLAAHLAPRFNYPIAVGSSDGTIATLASGPFVRVLYSTTGSAPYFEVPAPAVFDPTTGYVTLAKPSVSYFGTTANLAVGGASTDGIPSDVQAFLAVYKGANEVSAPADAAGPTEVHAGTAHALYGVARTLTITVPSWRDPSNLAAMAAYAADLLDTVKDVAYDCDLEVAGLYEELFDCGSAVNVLGASGYPTGLESAGLPCLECAIRWSPAGSPKFTTILKLSNRRAQFTAERFLHPAPTGEMLGGEIGGLAAPGFATAGMGGLGGAQLDAFGSAASGASAAFASTASGASAAFGSAASDSFGSAASDALGSFSF